MMEYLEMRGAVKLKFDADKSVVYSVLDKLRETEFVDAGYIDIGIEKNILSISAQGTISESYSTRALLTRLQGQLTETSMIGVSSVRWETLVVLKHWQPTLAMRLEATDQLVFAN
ncbi:hypothetical protein O0V09_16100 [Dasania sp. GY-19]|uniref:Uncharacterized protein n=1 Tax=Dasania phycosphaerae TaxID=2950436 RepID=A0A9J6RRF1_9GAMM|nr:hypothetical protein [Dasania phycosphaerae]MCZ0866735.1 hypothetical protein [Dasania phycosphaerae]